MTATAKVVPGLTRGALGRVFMVNPTMHGLNFIQDLALVLVVAGVVGWVCQRIGLSVVVGFLVAGVVLGPKSLPSSLIHDVDSIEALAQLGLVFLMFSIGLR